MGLKWRTWAWGLIWVLAWNPGSSWAEKRVALVIGNNAYQQVTPLAKAVNDARAIGKELQEFGFEVLLRTDVDRRGLLKARREFLDQLSGGDVAVLFYAGHGVQLQGTNYLLPVDIKADREQDVIDEAIDLASLLQQMADRRAKFSLAIIDACRNNPFKGQGRSIGVSRGLTTLSAPNGLMVIYSAGANEEAMDALGDQDQNPNSLFSRELIKVIRQPGLRVDEAVKKARGEVKRLAASVGHQQNPAIYDQTDGDFYFRLPLETAAEPGPRPGAVPPGAKEERLQTELELEYWKSIRDSRNAERFREYLDSYPKGTFAGVARDKLAELEAGKSGVRSATTPPPPVVPPQVGHLQINTNTEAEVWLEGKKLGWTKAGQPLNLTRLPLGMLEIEVRAKGYQEQKRRVELKPDQWEQLVIRLELDAPSTTTAKPQEKAFEPEMLSIKGGTFVMGSPTEEAGHKGDENQQPVTLKDFKIGKYEVTLGQFRRFVEATGYKTQAETGDGCYGWTGSDWEKRKDFHWRNLGFPQGEDHPVACVSWNDAMAYSEWLAKRTGKKYRLPTEAEWEYAARGGSGTLYWWGTSASHDKANYGKEECCGPTVMDKDRWEFTAAVGSFAPNSWALYDTAGNVWEWTCSAYAESYDGRERQCAGKNEAGAQRVLRGGSWVNSSAWIRSASRNWGPPGHRYANQGFRLAQSESQ